jgi:hypothetical protein
VAQLGGRDLDVSGRSLTGTGEGAGGAQAVLVVGVFVGDERTEG